MTYVCYDDPETVPAEIEARLEFDHTTCESGICCADERGRRAAIGGYLSVHPETSYDVPSWRAVCVREGLLLCEDCAAELDDPTPDVKP